MKKILLLMIMLITMQAVSAITVDVVSTNPAPIKAGEFADITLQIESSESESDYNNAKVEIVETKFFKPISTGDAEFDVFPSGRTVTKTFRIFIDEELPEGFVDLQVKFTSNEVTFDIDSRVFVEGAQTLPELLIGQVRTVPKELLPDTDNNKLIVTLQNLGDKDAELVKAKLKSTNSISPSYSFSMQDSVASIKSGEEKDLEFTIDINEFAKGEVPSILEVRYRTEVSDSYKTFEEKIPLSIEMIDSPLLKIESVELKDSFVGGTAENKVLITIKNEGEEDADEVRVRVVPDISYPLIFDTSTQYVTSKIKPGDTATVVFFVEVTSDAQDKTYDITTKLESLVGDARYSREDVLSITTKQGVSTSSGIVATIVVLVVIAIALFIGYKRLSARRKRKK